MVIEVEEIIGIMVSLITAAVGILFLWIKYLLDNKKKEYIKIIKCSNPSMCNCIDCGESNDFCDYHKEHGNQILEYTFYRKRSRTYK